MRRLTCNINRRGRIARASSGILFLVAAILIIWLGIPATAWIRWTFFVFLALFGGFQIFEGCVGWCATRALGIKTPM
ncbi:MAG: hypothetical protein ABIG44_12435 [Planctomycetota bacterium]